MKETIVAEEKMRYKRHMIGCVPIDHRKKYIKLFRSLFWYQQKHALYDALLALCEDD